MYCLGRLLTALHLVEFSFGLAVGSNEYSEVTKSVHVTLIETSTVTVTPAAFPKCTIAAAGEASRLIVDVPAFSSGGTLESITTATAANNAEYKVITVTATVTATTFIIQALSATESNETPASSAPVPAMTTVTVLDHPVIPKFPGSFNWNRTLESEVASSTRSPCLPSYQYSPISKNYSSQTNTSTITSSHGDPGSPLPTPEHCGLWGNFTLNWDDEPLYLPSENSNSAAGYPPIFNPYHKLFFSNGYGYAPLPPVMYKPSSPPLLALFLPNDTTKDIGSPYAAGKHTGEIGAGPRSPLTAFWFNVHSVDLGCENFGPAHCHVDIKGFKYHNESETEIFVAKQHFEIPACPTLTGCTLMTVNLTREFKGLTGITFGAMKGGIDVPVFMDDLHMAWCDNSCEAGLLRVRERK